MADPHESLRYFTVGSRLPKGLAVALFGDRNRYGQTPFRGDPCWQEWSIICEQFHMATQHAGVRKVVNYSGYKVMNELDLSGKRVLEIGPGTIGHMAWWRGRPAQYDLFDVNEDMMAHAVKALSATGIAHNTYLRSREDEVRLPVPTECYDVVVSFYSLEHLHPLERYLAEIVRALKPGGHLIGAIPCEGGVGWGLGRLLTTWRWFKKNSTIDPAKWICWEHPNVAGSILRALDGSMRKTHLSYYPFFFLPLIDPNLILKFVYQKV